MPERRLDPRTSKPYSLENLLRMRAASVGLLLAVVGTPDGFLMASSRERGDKQGARLAAHASAELFGAAGRSEIELGAPTGVQLVARRIEVEGRAAFIAVLVAKERGFTLDELAASVHRILNEPARTRAAA